MFGKKKVKQPDLKELTALVDDHTKILSGMNDRLNNFDLEIEKIKSHIISLRGFVNRRMAGEMPGETSKNTDGLDDLRR